MCVCLLRVVLLAVVAIAVCSFVAAFVASVAISELVVSGSFVITVLFRCCCYCLVFAARILSHCWQITFPSLKRLSSVL